MADDVADTRRMVASSLTGQGFRVDEAESGPAALAKVAENRPDLVLLDINMPGMSGVEVMSQLRLHDVPVILLTGRDEEDDRVMGLEMGAEDYVVKPFYVRELVARTRSVLRRADAARRISATTTRLDFGAVTIRLNEREVLVDGVLVETTPKEFDLLAFLASSPRAVFGRHELLDLVWGSSTEWQDPATVTEHVRKLRKKIEPDPENPVMLHTVRGVGYRFDPPPAERLSH